MISNCQDGSLGIRQPGRDISGHCWASARLPCRHGAPRPPRSLVAPRRRRAAWATSRSSIRRRTMGGGSRAAKSHRGGLGVTEAAPGPSGSFGRGAVCGGGHFCVSFLLDNGVGNLFRGHPSWISSLAHPTLGAQGDGLPASWGMEMGKRFSLSLSLSLPPLSPFSSSPLVHPFPFSILRPSSTPYFHLFPFCSPSPFVSIFLTPKLSSQFALGGSPLGPKKRDRPCSALSELTG